MFTQETLPAEAAEALLSYACKNHPKETLDCAFEYLTRIGTDNVTTVAIARIDTILTKTVMNSDVHDERVRLLNRLISAKSTWFNRTVLGKQF